MNDLFEERLGNLVVVERTLVACQRKFDRHGVRLFVAKEDGAAVCIEDGEGFVEDKLKERVQIEDTDSF